MCISEISAPARPVSSISRAVLVSGCLVPFSYFGSIFLICFWFSDCLRFTFVVVAAAVVVCHGCSGLVSILALRGGVRVLP